MWIARDAQSFFTQKKTERLLSLFSVYRFLLFFYEF